MGKFKVTKTLNLNFNHEMFVERNLTTNEMILTFPSLSAASASVEGLHMFHSCYRWVNWMSQKFIRPTLKPIVQCTRFRFFFKSLFIFFSSSMEILEWPLKNTWCLTLMDQVRDYFDVVTRLWLSFQVGSLGKRLLAVTWRRKCETNKNGPRWTWLKWTTLKSE